MATIMVVDDAMFMRKKCAQVLTDKGHVVIEAASGSEAVNAYKKSRPDAVLLDITMPDMDGLQALKELLKIDPSARISMCSAMGQQSMVIESLKAGAVDFVVKPFDVARVMEAVKKMVG
ncbi:MAG: response regulator [Dehalococcoidales bacterium]|jgi:two-component system chemotaxis response regulator CheY